MDRAEGWWRVVGMSGGESGMLDVVSQPMVRTPHPSFARSLALPGFATLSPEGRGGEEMAASGCKGAACPAFAYCQGRCAAKRDAKQRPVPTVREDYSGGGYLA